MPVNEEEAEMKVLESKLMKDFARMCMDGYNLGWHERNGGNLSYRMKESEVEELKEDFGKYEASMQTGEWAETGTQVPSLAGEYFMVTGTGKYFRNVELDPAANVCILELDETGTKYRIVWGLVNGTKPTSELPSHLMNLEVLKQRDENLRVVYHCHPANTIALTYVLPLDSRVFTRELFEMAPECPMVFPKGIGVLPWMVCGGRKIGAATSEIMKKQDVAIWAQHGAFVCGRDFDMALGLMHTVEKAAEVLIKVMSITNRKVNTIHPDEFRQLNEPYGIEIGEEFLYERKTGIIGELPD